MMREAKLITQEQCTMSRGRRWPGNLIKLRSISSGSFNELRIQIGLLEFLGYHIETCQLGRTEGC
jgi:hypothetical protein